MADKLQQAALISKNIKHMRELLGWTQARLASEAGITAAALSKIEKDEGRMPTIVVLRKIASALGVKPYEITGEDAPENSGDKTTEFYRKWGELDKLPEQDQRILREMMERFTKK
ncbi:MULTISPECIES: helix-turn-helix domain-containing protein [Gammaproteobacteria]|jgi:transcriptional regulator with XRE-family HTH domain|uniref:helix-turn-helix domain-containing protein n=2 Tax=Pseudomonadota TaxID=1224 RepID=UPI0004E2FE98|nr:MULTISPECIES: helix-turn-helix transcriptional regulator [Gammaproteobacteria]EGQ8013969.1 helix-turn-helix transcriptional regulator [Vibrio cholerae]EGQ9854201.1 helix-turn-helix transcriptional regulator [Vibrio cholerae]EGR0581193.1 helix-turn-helix transcriptional regulator [Vibrio cholerae]EGR3958612.1 XRE family transcriptional regulator [Vibrio cholerae]EKF9795356.1 helix-turn-helix transcriptional regulator [Vibrio cholerae]